MYDTYKDAGFRDFIRNFIRGLKSKNPFLTSQAAGATGAASKLKLELLRAIDTISNQASKMSNEFSFARKNPGLYKSFKMRELINSDQARQLAKELKYSEREMQNLYREFLKQRQEIAKLKYGPYYREILDLKGAIKPLTAQ